MIRTSNSKSKEKKSIVTLSILEYNILLSLNTRDIQKVCYTHIMYVKNTLLRSVLPYTMTQLQHTISLHNLLIAADICLNVHQSFDALTIEYRSLVPEPD